MRTASWADSGELTKPTSFQKNHKELQKLIFWSKSHLWKILINRQNLHKPDIFNVMEIRTFMYS